MGLSADAIMKIKANTELRSHRVSKFTSSKFLVSVSGSNYNKEYLKSKFSLAKQKVYLKSFTLEKRSQKILNWTFWLLTLCTVFFFFYKFIS